MKYCSKCVLPETHETISFDTHGVCNICDNIAQRDETVDWSEKKSELDEIVQRHKGQSNYDCIVPFSGGKDSTWTLYYLVKEYGLKPLVVRFDHGFLRDTLNDNAERTFRTLGVDSISFKPNWHTVRKLMLQSLIDKGDFCWHCHTGIFSYPMWVAIKERVPLIIWGEPSAEYTAYYSYDNVENVDEERFNRYINLGINADDMFLRLGGNLDKRDLLPYSYPPLEDLRSLGYESICLGSYVKWDVKVQSEVIQRELGWAGDEVENVPPQYYYEKIECHMQGVRDYIKYLKRGYSRTTHLTSIDIRNKRLTKMEAETLIRQYEGKRPPSLDLFLNYLGITEKQFNEFVLSNVVSPHQPDFGKIEHGLKTHDFDSWWCDNGMSADEAKAIIQNAVDDEW